MSWEALLSAAAPYVMPAITSAAGGAMSYFGKPKQAQTTQLPTINPEQQAWRSQTGQMAMQGLQDPSQGFDPIAQRARSQFQTQTIPSLAERFTGFGQGGQRSSDFMGAAAGAGADLEEGLSAQGAQFGLQNRGLLQQLLGMGMQPGFENIYQPEQMGGLQRFGTSMFEQGMPMMSSAIRGQQANTQMDKFFGHQREQAETQQAQQERQAEIQRQHEYEMKYGRGGR